MKPRLVLGIAIATAVAVVIAVVAWPRNTHTANTSVRSAKIDPQVRPRTGDTAPTEAPKKPVRMVMTESGPQPAIERAPREWVDPKNGALNREIVDSIPDPEADAREQLAYKRGRLRLALFESAQECSNGVDSNDSIEIEYDLVVKSENLVAQNVRVKHSSLPDPGVQSCIVNAVRDLSTIAEGVPDMTEAKSVLISMHDIYVGKAKRDRQDQAASATPDEPTAVDKPTASPPPGSE